MRNSVLEPLSGEAGAGRLDGVTGMAGGTSVPSPTPPPAAQRSSRREALLAVVVSAIAVVVVARWAMVSGSRIDVDTFRAAGHAVLRGASPYGISAVVPFVYPPAGALLVLPTVVGPSAAAGALAWIVLSLAALARTAWLLARMAWPDASTYSRVSRMGWLLAGACVLEPTLVTLSYGQVGLVLLWLVVEGMAQQPDGARRTWLVGVAAAVKLTPLVVVVALVAARRWRSAAWAAVGLVGATATAAVLAPAAMRDYVGGTWRLAQGVNSTPDLFNHSLIGTTTLLAAPAWVGLALAAATLVGGVVLTAALWRRGDELAGLATVLVTGLLVSPVSWPHHWVAAYPALVLLVREVGRLSGRTAATALLVLGLLGMLTWIDQVGVEGSRVLPDGATWWVVPREWYVVWGLAFLAYVAATVVHIGRRDPVRAALSTTDAAPAERPTADITIHDDDHAVVRP
jgi:alpha-1,2-mannosyltransferase